MTYTNFGYSTLKNNGDVKNSLNFVFVAEGFLATEIAVFNSACQDKMNAILNCSPWKEQAYELNFFAVPVISLESGISHPCLWPTTQCNVIPAMPKKIVNSYFGISYDQAGIHRFVLPTNQQTINIMNTVAASMPLLYKVGAANFEPIVICNDPNYGGSEAGSVATTTLNAQSNEVLLHELGHSVAACNDEYPGGSIMRAWNTDTQNDLTKIIWKALVPQGAAAIQIGSEILYKGFAVCKMNTLGSPYCLVCSTQIIKSIGQLISISGGTPKLPPVNPPPLAPTGLTTAGNDSVSLACQPVAEATFYTFNLTGFPVVTSTNPAVTFVGLLSKTAYSCTVTVTTANGTSLPSAPFNFTTP